MKKLLLLLTLISPLVLSQDILIRDGATCDIPDGYNAATFNEDYNPKGMGRFCRFPLKSLSDAIRDKFENCVDTDYIPPQLPKCNGLVLSPNIQVFPCYEVREK